MKHFQFKNHFGKALSREVILFGNLIGLLSCFVHIPIVLSTNESSALYFIFVSIVICSFFAFFSFKNKWIEWLAPCSVLFLNSVSILALFTVDSPLIPSYFMLLSGIVYSVLVLQTSLLPVALTAFGIFLIYYANLVFKPGTNAVALSSMLSALSAQFLILGYVTVFKLRYNRLGNILADQLFESQLSKKTLIHDLANKVMIALHSCKKLNLILSNNKDSEIHLNKINRSVQAMQEIIESVRKIEALRSGKAMLNKNSFRIDEMILKLKENFVDELAKKELSLVWTNLTDEAQDLEISSDKEILEHQILANIFTNAIKFSQPKSQIKITFKKTNDGKLLEIKDQGVGMPKELLDNLFRLDVKTSRRGTQNEEGTGFGMPILKAFADALKIGVRVTSTEAPSDEQGTTISLEFKATG